MTPAEWLAREIESRRLPASPTPQLLALVADVIAEPREEGHSDCHASGTTAGATG